MKNIELAKVLMENDWFSKSGYDSMVNRIGRFDLPWFDEIPHGLLEQREDEEIDCGLSDNENCTKNYKCELCEYCVKNKVTRYHFKDSPSEAVCKEQIEILKYFNII